MNGVQPVAFGARRLVAGRVDVLGLLAAAWAVCVEAVCLGGRALKRTAAAHVQHTNVLAVVGYQEAALEYLPLRWLELREGAQR